MDAMTEAPAPDAVLPAGAIDCDIHPPSPSMTSLRRHMDEYWSDMMKSRGIGALDSNAYPDNAPITARPDWRGESGGLDRDPARLKRDTLDRWGIGHAILNSLYGVHLVFDEYMAIAFARAVNDWMIEEWLDQDDRLRASIVVPIQSVEASVAEIERLAPDRRFVQILLPVMAETPYGRRSYWPIYAAAMRHGLPIGIHAGSSYRHPVTALGWPSYYVEDYVAQSQGFQAQLTSLVTAGVFGEFPDLKVVLLESGVAWLPAYLWRLSKFWKGLRFEVPWVDRSPTEIVRDHVRLTMQPFDAPDDPAIVEKIADQLGSDEMLLFASDYPHWQFDGDALIPRGFDAGLVRKMALDNPRRTYPHLTEATA